MLSHKDVSDLEFALSWGGLEHSSQGPISERLFLFSGTSDGAHKRRHGPLTADITAEVRQQTREEPNLHSLEKYGRASRKLQRVAEHDAAMATVLVLYHGDAGARWGRGQYGREGALLHLTRAGRRLITKAKRANKLELTDAERIESEVAVEAAQTKASRAELIGRAMVEAGELYRRACDVWCEVNK